MKRSVSITERQAAEIAGGICALLKLTRGGRVELASAAALNLTLLRYSDAGFYLIQTKEAHGDQFDEQVRQALEGRGAWAPTPEEPFVGYWGPRPLM